MAHTTKTKQKLLNRVRRIRGQVDGIARALDEEQDCSAVLQMIAACRGAMNGLMMEVLEGHLNEHVIDADANPTRAQREAARELMEVIKTYLK